MADDKDKEIEAELASSKLASEGDPEGRAVQESITSPSGIPDYLSFLNGPPGAGGVADPENIEIDATPTGAAPQSPLPPGVGKMSVSSQGATLDPLATRERFTAPNDPMAAAAGEMESLNRDADASRRAVEEREPATEKYHRDLADLLKREEDANMWAAAQDERIASESSAEAHKYMAAFEAQSSAARRMAVDPTGPLGQLTGWKAAGLGLAEFSQGFLAARGIHIDVSGQVDRWVQRSIHEQERQVQQAEAGARDQLTMWEVARQTSRDRQEAVHRYTGWTVAGLQAAAKQHAEAFNSDTARADADAAIAALQTKYDEAKWNIWKGAYQAHHADAELAEKQADDAVKNSIARGHLTIEKERADAAKGAKPEKIPGYLPDFTHPVTDEKGNVVGYEPAGKISQNQPAAEARYKELADAVPEAHQAAQNLKELKQFQEMAQRELGGNVTQIFQDTALAKRFSDAKRRYDSLKTTLAAHLAKASFGRVTQNEFQKTMDALPFDKFIQRGSTTDIIDDKVDEVNRGIAAKLSTAEQLDRGDLGNVDTGSGGPLKLNHEGKIYLPRSQYAAEDIESAEAGREAERAGEPPVSTFEGSEFKQVADQSGAATTTRAWKTLMPEGVVKAVSPPPGVHAMELLAMGALNPSKVRDIAKKEQLGYVEDDDATARESSLSALRALTKNDDARVSHFARALIGEIHSDPSALEDMVSNWSSK